jgi:hypothetical protein
MRIKNLEFQDFMLECVCTFLHSLQVMCHFVQSNPQVLFILITI